ncbi:MAG: anti-sigma factor family protein [Pseudobdellovibrio sp.]
MNDDISSLVKNNKSRLSYKVPNSLRTEIMRELFPQKQSTSAFRWLSFGGGIAATVCALVLSFQLGRISVNSAGNMTSNDEVISAHVRSLQAQHLSDVVSTDQHTVKPWFEGKIDFGPVVKDFVNSGFPLIGGRLDYLAGRNTAALVYKSDLHIINVFQYPISGNEVAPQFETGRGFQVFTWSKNGMRFTAVSDLNASDLQRFVSLW